MASDVCMRVVHIVMDNEKLAKRICIWCFMFGSNAKEIVSSFKYLSTFGIWNIWLIFRYYSSNHAQCSTLHIPTVLSIPSAQTNDLQFNYNFFCSTKFPQMPEYEVLRITMMLNIHLENCVCVCYFSVDVQCA